MNLKVMLKIIERLWLRWLVLLGKKMDRNIMTFDREIRVPERAQPTDQPRKTKKNKREKTGR